MPSNGTISIGIVSFAHGHVRTYCNEWKQMDGVRLVAAWDDDIERGKTAAESYGMEFTADLGDLVSRPDIDLIVIASETAKHADHAVAAAAAGKDILLQKPMALRVEDCDRIIEAVDKAGVWFSMAYQMRYDPSNQKIKQLVEDGTLGKIILLRRRHCISVLFSPDFVSGPSRWHLDPALNMGMFMDDASHAADFIYWVLGRPATCMAEITAVVVDPSVTPDDTGTAIYRYEDNKLAILTNSSVTWAGENTTEVHGDKGVLIQNHDDGPSTSVLPDHPVALKMWLADERDKGWQNLGVEIPPAHGARIAAVAHGALDDYRNGHVRCSARDGKVSVEMVLAAYRSAAEGRRVPV
ncbi:MAG: Gfo/Idh/MocA family oxidoreductase [Armatimonadetes bacterium]|nr:Gfo/Idh/MocA family oxidoreductase [Armatimonadota bacterium]